MPLVVVVLHLAVFLCLFFLLCSCFFLHFFSICSHRWLVMDHFYILNKILKQKNAAAALALPASIWRAPGTTVADAAPSVWLPRLLELIRAAAPASSSATATATASATNSTFSPEFEAALYRAARNAVVR